MQQSIEQTDSGASRLLTGVPGGSWAASISIEEKVLSRYW